MRVSSWITPFCFSVVLSLASMLAPIEVSAVCCGCGKCWMKYYTNPPCNCPGEGGCPTCLSDETEPVQTFEVAHKYLDVTARVKDLMKGGMCFRERAALSLLGKTRDSLKLELVHFDGDLLSALNRGTDN